MDPIAALGAKVGLKAPVAASNEDGKAGSATTRKVAEDFTALLVGQLVREMFKTVSSESENGPFGDGPGADVYKSLAEGALSQALAKKGLDSLTDRVHELIKPPEVRT